MQGCAERCIYTLSFLIVIDLINLFRINILLPKKKKSENCFIKNLEIMYV